MNAEQLNASRKVARKAFNMLSTDPEYSFWHDSHRAARALEVAERFLKSIGCNDTFGVEGFVEHGGCQYLNTGDTYGTTILYRKGQFRIGCWGDIVERCHA